MTESDRSGDTYEVEVPDTLDLPERAKLSINFLTTTADPAFDYATPVWIRPDTKPPYMHHGDYTSVCEVKVIRALPLMRVMSGSDFNGEIDGKKTDAIMDDVGERGLWWCKHHHLNYPTTERYGPHRYPLSDEDFSSPNGNFDLVTFMMIQYQLDGDPAWKERIQEIADTWRDIVLYRDDYAYIPDSMIGEVCCYPRSGWRPGMTREPRREVEGAEGSMFDVYRLPIRALSLWYKMSGDEEALELARKLLNFVLKPRFWSDVSHARFREGYEDPLRIHLWTHDSIIWSVLEYATAAKDQRLINFAREGYEYLRSLGIPRIGCFLPGTEACASAGMVSVAIKLSDAGVGDYWEDVDQYVRNQFIEHQAVRADLLRDVSERGEPHEVVPPYEVNGQAIDKGVGCFFSTATPTTLRSTAVVCCPANGAMGLYSAWESIVRGQDNAAQINLLLNRASPWLDIDSYLPYEGKVVIRNKTAKRITVRIPRWVDPGAVRSDVNGREAGPFWLNNYLVFDGLDGKDVVTIRFPMVESEEKYTLAGQEYTCYLKGNTLVDISPREGKGYPIYLRDFYRQDRAPAKKVTRHVSPLIPQW